MNNTENFKLELGKYLDGNAPIFLYWKGRIALFALLKAMGIGKGDEVIIPGFTCVVVPNAIKYLGAKPIYIDVEINPMNASPESYKKALTSKTKVIITQNTFGLSYRIDEIADLAKSEGIYSIEDCTHGFGGTFKGMPNGSFCDAAFFSTQWNKPFSTGIGGFSVVNNISLLPSLEDVNKNLLKPRSKDQIILSALLFARDKILTESNYWNLRKLYRFLSRHNLVVGSSQGQELTGTEMPANYFKGISPVQIKKGNISLAGFGDVIQRRKKNALVYSGFLAKHAKNHVDLKYHQNHSFLKYPLLVKDREKFENLAFHEKIELGDWFCSPVYPVQENWEIWDLDHRSIPNSLFLTKHIVNLPTETLYPEKVIIFVRKYLDEVLSESEVI